MPVPELNQVGTWVTAHEIGASAAVHAKLRLGRCGVDADTPTAQWSRGTRVCCASPLIALESRVRTGHLPSAISSLRRP